jgi:fatty-acid desaturase
MNLSTFKRKYISSNYNVSQYVIIVQLILAVIGMVYIYFDFSWLYFWMPLMWYFFLLWWCHHVGLHRYFSHGSFQVSPWMHKVLCFTSCLVTFGSPFSYALMHRAHHLHSDTDKDTHAPTRIGILRTMFFKWEFAHLGKMDRNRMIDKWALMAHQNYVFIVLGFYIILHMISPVLAFTYNIGVLISFFGVAYVNAFSHIKNPLNYRNFETSDLSSNNVFVGIIGGEYHNNHHKNPQKWNQRVRWWEFDGPAQIIKLIKKEKND